MPRPMTPLLATAAAVLLAAIPQDGNVERVKRKHAKKPAAEFLYLQDRFEPGTKWGSREISRREAERDLDQLEWELVNRFAYLRWKGVDYEAALDTIRLGFGDGITCGALAIQVMKLLALFGDAHSKVIEPSSDTMPNRFADFLFGDTEAGVAAFHGNRSGFLDPARPYVASLDGVPVADWIEAAGAVVAKGSPQLVRRHSVRNLRYVGRVRQELGLPDEPRLKVELVDADGGNAATVERPVVGRRAAYGSWPRRDTGVLEGNVGYLRIAHMDHEPEFLDGLGRAMEDFRDTSALIIDVRGNGGGRRNALRLLLPYFLAPDAPPYVANLAAYRLPPDEGREDRDGHLANRFLYPVSASVWSKTQKKAIQAFAKGFKPEWKLPKKEFTSWHYLVLEPAGAGGGYHYEKPVVVLLDPVCFSATDIFLGGFRGLPNVTLIGAPSGGGSGRSRKLKLANSRIDLQLSSMASFQRDGSTYDGNGVQPDVVVWAVATDFIGETDTVLDAALEHLGKAK